MWLNRPQREEGVGLRVGGGGGGGGGGGVGGLAVPCRAER